MRKQYIQKADVKHCFEIPKQFGTNVLNSTAVPALAKKKKKNYTYYEILFGYF
jgi:hypothetical protein